MIYHIRFRSFAFGFLARGQRLEPLGTHTGACTAEQMLTGTEVPAFDIGWGQKEGATFCFNVVCPLVRRSPSSWRLSLPPVCRAGSGVRRTGCPVSILRSGGFLCLTTKAGAFFPLLRVLLCLTRRASAAVTEVDFDAKGEDAISS